MGFVIEFKKLLKEGTRVKVNIINIRVKTIITNENIILVGFLSIRDRKENIDRDKLKLLINEEEFDIKFPFKRIKVIRGLAILSNFYIIKIPIEKLLTGNIHNKPFFIYKKDGEIVLKRSLRYNLFSNVNNYYTSRAKILKDKNTSVYVRQSAKNRVMITVRNINKTDYPKEQIKINLAFLFSKIIPKNKIIMYEKNSSRYEESASVLYEKLMDLGYKNIYYIINKDNEKIKNINDKYKKHLVYKYSFRHYLYFFIAKTLIGTESPGHAIELRTANRHSTKRIYSNKFNYVFLQHGVMYMVSLDSDGRSFFRKGGGMPRNAKIIVSSKEEEKHFIELGGDYEEKDFYVTGLPKFDKSIRYKNADKIVIMPTWRPWEFNLLRVDAKDAPYYKMLEEIIESIPKKYKNKIVLLPHPLVINNIKNTPLNKYIIKNKSYDEILRKTDILITDYSSIAYDAFYRGANVIFWWKEKDFCMEQYNGHLMLNDNNAFGTVCYKKEELTQNVNNLYKQKQKEEYIKKYRKIVEFHDNKNTERLVECLQKDKIIKKVK